MTIGFDASRAFDAQRTGTENYSFQLLKNLCQVDKSNTYYIFVKQNQISNIKLLENAPKNFQIIPINLPKLWTQIGLSYKTFQYKMDVLFVPSHTLPLIRKTGLKTVITVHDLGVSYLPKTHQLKQRLYLNFMTHQQIQHATCIIAVSQATKDDIIKVAGIAPEKITVIYEGYDQKLFRPQTPQKINQTLQKYQLANSHLTTTSALNYFLFVGTVQPRKNLARLIQAFKMFLLKMNRSQTFHHPPKLFIAGSYGWLSDEIYQLPKTLDIEQDVVFLGYVDQEDLPRLYSGAIALLFPSLFEGFGLPILEAMACGCPVLTSNVSSMPEVAGQAAILVNPNSPESIANGIIEMIDANLPAKNTGKRAHLKQLGFKQVKKFSWEKCAKQTLEVFKTLDYRS